MQKILVWDIPLRLFHGLFAVSLSAALLIGLTVDEHNALFPYHMLFGLIAAFLLVIRVVIGWVGGRHARLRGLIFSPVETAGYMVTALAGRSRRYAGHNPGTAAAALVMFVLVAGLVWTGLNMTDGGEELHEAMAYGVAAAIAAHLAGLVLHAYHHRENIFAGMFTGKKQGEPSDALPSAKGFAGLVILLVCGIWISLLFNRYDATRSTVTIPGLATVTLGEGASDMDEPHGYGGGGHEEEDEDDD